MVKFKVGDRVACDYNIDIEYVDLEDLALGTVVKTTPKGKYCYILYDNILEDLDINIADLLKDKKSLQDIIDFNARKILASDLRHEAEAKRKLGEDLDKDCEMEEYIISKLKGIREVIKSLSDLARIHKYDIHNNYNIDYCIEDAINELSQL